MRIALFHPWIKSRGGAERVVLEYLKHTKHEVVVYTWVYDERNTFDEFKNYKINVLAPKFFDKLARLFVFRGLFIFVSFFSKIQLDKYDIFFISSGGLGETITFRNYKKNNTFIYVHTILRAACKEDIKWNLKYRFLDPIKKLFYLFAVKIYLVLERLAWKKINFVMVNSELSFNRAKSHNLLSNKVVRVIYPGVDLKGLRNSKPKNYFLYVARFGVSKRQDLLLHAWDKFRQSHMNYKLILVGTVENESYFAKIERMAKVIGNVEIITDANDEKRAKLFSSCMAVVFVPFMEDFGIVPFEAFASGKTLIAVDNSGYFNLVKKAPSVILVREKSELGATAVEVTKGLLKFVENRNYFIKKGIKNITFVKKLDLSWPKVINKIDYFLEENVHGK